MFNKIIRYTIILVLVLAFFTQCGTPAIIQSYPTSFHTVNFTIPQPKNKDKPCYLKHQAAGQPTTLIKYHFFIEARYFGSRGGNYTELIDHTDFIVDPNTQSFPYAFKLNHIPTDRPVAIFVDVQGVNCSECSSGYSDQDGPAGNPFCNADYISGSGFLAATPRWLASNQIDASVVNFNLTTPLQTINVPNTCNCYVN